MVSFIQHNPYLSLLIATTLEGPIATFVAGALAAKHILRIEYVIAITILGDVLGDLGLFLGGRYFSKLGFIQKLISKVPRKQKVAHIVSKKPFIYLTMAKLTPYFAMPVLSFLGTQHLSIRSFIGYSLIVSTIVKILYSMLGYLGAISIQQFEIFLNGREKIIVYIITGIVFFFLARIVYRYLGLIIKKRIRK